ncbi:MAG: extracellular solute-binding protein, partial [Anaerolineaceae bacterium]|nr:extracellular solute-binding protein [Anaerolineaceae bacterium]
GGSTAITPLPEFRFDPEKLDGLKITFWHPWNGDMAIAIADLVEEFNGSNVWGVSVELLAPGGPGMLMDLMDQNINTGALPNVLAASSEELLFWQDKTAFLIDLNVYINEPQWGLSSQEISEIPQGFWKQVRSNDQQVGIPALQDLQVLYYNQGWAETLGFFSPPETLPEFQKQICEAAAERAAVDETGGWIVDTEALTMLSWIMASGSQDFADIETGVYQFETDESEEIFTFLRNLLDEGCAWHSREPEPYDYFAHRQTLIYSGSLLDIRSQTQYMQELNSPDEWGMIPYPFQGEKPLVIASGESYGMLNASIEEQLASWLLMRWLILPRNQAKLAEIEGYLPVSISAIEYMQAFRKAHPKWNDALQWIPIVQSPPPLGSWLIVQYILEDAAWQTFQSNSTIQAIPPILAELDLMIPDVLENQP